MCRTLADRIVLNNGVGLPWLGLELRAMRDNKAVQSMVEAALEAGFRGFDASALRGNEASLGRALRASGLARDEVFITARVAHGGSGDPSARGGLDRVLDRFGLDYLDLALLDGPAPGRYARSWAAMEEAYAEGRVRAIGVADFDVEHVQELIARRGIRPAVNRIELSSLSRKQMQGFCAARGIQVQAGWSTADAPGADHPALATLAHSLGQTPTQLVLRWAMQRNTPSVVGVTTLAEIREIAGIFDFQLDEEALARIGQLDLGVHARADIASAA